MSEVYALLALIAALGIGVVSPGPSFVMVARTAVAQGRANGVAASLGMGLGGAIFAIAALLGLQAIFAAVPSLYIALKVLGGAYLCYLGFLIFRGASQALNVDTEDAKDSQRWSTGKAFWLGFTTQVSNPKTSIIYASVFAALLPTAFSLAFAVAVVITVFIVEAAWYLVVALALSAQAPRKAYLSYKLWMDRAAGLVMAGLGLSLLASVLGEDPKQR